MSYVSREHRSDNPGARRWDHEGRDRGMPRGSTSEKEYTPLHAGLVKEDKLKLGKRIYSKGPRRVQQYAKRLSLYRNARTTGLIEEPFWLPSSSRAASFKDAILVSSASPWLTLHSLNM